MSDQPQSVIQIDRTTTLSRCSACRQTLTADNFYPDKTRTNECSSTCKLCKKLLRKVDYKLNKVKILARNKKYKVENKAATTAKNTAYSKRRRAADVGVRLKDALRNRLYYALKKRAHSARTLDLLGCSINELRAHFEAKFKPGMTWENYGLWHIDHIVPLAKFDLSIESEVFKASNFMNLQPLWALENRMKSDS